MAYARWTKKIVHAEALKYQTKSEFYRGSRNAYQHAAYHGFLDEICCHMQSNVCLSERCIYRAYSELIHHQYIGLTCNISERFDGKWGHRNSSSPRANKGVKLILTQPDHKIDILHEFTDINSAVLLEKEEIARHIAMSDWTTVNRNKGGSL